MNVENDSHSTTVASFYAFAACFLSPHTWQWPLTFLKVRISEIFFSNHLRFTMTALAHSHAHTWAESRCLLFTLCFLCVWAPWPLTSSHWITQQTGGVLGEGSKRWGSSLAPGPSQMRCRSFLCVCVCWQFPPFFFSFCCRAAGLFLFQSFDSTKRFLISCFPLICIFFFPRKKVLRFP